MKKLAIIGTGIAGLGCAYFLQPRFEVTLYERNDYAGGHTNTVTVTEGTETIPIDTGFMVYNEVTYPNLTRLFRELAVKVKPAAMSFSVQHRRTGLEFSGSSLNHLFAQRRNLMRLQYWRMIFQINRFNGEAVAALESSKYADMTLGEYVRERGYGEDFLQLYLVPMSSAVWSTPPELMLEFPAVTLLRFFHNHGFLGLHTQHPWLTVAGGAKTYVEKIIAPLRDRLQLRCGATRVSRANGEVQIIDASGKTAGYDEVILACHADEALRLLADADSQERAVLGEFKYQPNLATLHTDASVMPRNRRCWSSWNYRMDYDAAGRLTPSTTYWMNSLQRVSERENYFVSINGEDTMRPDSVRKRISYEHPLFSRGAIRAQTELPRLNERRTGVWFCGSYFRYGFHEDAFTSALGVARQLAEGVWN